ncbi:MAG: hypothetical protein Q7R45_11770 [Sulfuricaulis sp.]|nr:hypothetical protein [Sulfuricaulis sp.]
MFDITRSQRRIHLRRFVPVILVGLSLLASGCATIHEETCEQFEENRKDTDYSTQYQFSESDSETAAKNFKPLPRGANAVVRLYRIHLDPPKVKPCRHLTIRKEIYLQQSARLNRTLEEVREIYTSDGALIATKTESVGDRLRTSGYYTGETLLPIPENAPLGKYRIVSKLVLKTKKKSQAIVLTKTSASFQVLSRQ